MLSFVKELLCLLSHSPSDVLPLAQLLPRVVNASLRVLLGIVDLQKSHVVQGEVTVPQSDRNFFDLRVALRFPSQVAFPHETDRLCTKKVTVEIFRV